METFRKEILEKLLSQNPIKRLPLYHFQKPEAITETLKFIFCKRFKLSYDDVEIIGTLKKQKQTSESLEITDCILLGAAYDIANNSLIETSKPYVHFPEINLFPRRKVMRSATSLLFPLFYQSSLTQWKEIVKVEIESTLPENHWILRGVKFVTTEKRKVLFP